MSRVYQVSPAALALIVSFESFEPEAYRCQAGKWTLGIGSTHNREFQRPVQKGDVITFPLAYEWFLADVNDIARALEDRLAASMTIVGNNQFGALVSLGYNWGIQRLLRSETLYAVLDGDIEGIKREWSEIINYTTSAGRKAVSSGLKKRRKAELELFFSEII